MKRGDWAVLLALLALAGGLWLLLRMNGGRAEIYVNGARVSESLTVNGVEIELDGGRARVVSSPCGDQRCVRAGWIARPGEAVVCLPQRVIVEVRGAKRQVDGIAG